MEKNTQQIKERPKAQGRKFREIVVKAVGIALIATSLMTTSCATTRPALDTRRRDWAEFCQEECKSDKLTKEDVQLNISEDAYSPYWQV